MNDNKLKAKTVSLIAKIIGIVVRLIGSYAVGKHWIDLSVNDIIKIGGACILCVGTIDLNIIFDKFTKNDK